MKKDITKLSTKNNKNQLSELFLRYESSIESQRLLFEKDIFPILGEEDPKILLLFWINFCSQGTNMTEPVESWIRRAGERCKVLGYTTLGENLCKHAIHEAGHDLMQIEDTKRLVNLWNQLYTPTLNAEALLKRSANAEVRHYQALHEDCIQGNSPYGQIAIEYEIENLSVVYGKQIIDHTVSVLGKEILSCLSFLDDHVVIDVAHTDFNRKVLQDFLNEEPQALPHLVNAGIQSLKTYGACLASFYNDAVNYRQ